MFHEFSQLTLTHIQMTFLLLNNYYTNPSEVFPENFHLSPENTYTIQCRWYLWYHDSSHHQPWYWFGINYIIFSYKIAEKSLHIKYIIAFKIHYETIIQQLFLRYECIWFPFILLYCSFNPFLHFDDLVMYFNYNSDGFFSNDVFTLWECCGYIFLKIIYISIVTY